ncbi:hypothetical protein BDR03DRAFT_162838 [Suillus americanus]|nr:hypothetical protein BDR03DRAFT_162838 [Suillus americanus]
MGAHGGAGRSVTFIQHLRKIASSGTRSSSTMSWCLHRIFFRITPLLRSSSAPQAPFSKPNVSYSRLSSTLGKTDTSPAYNADGSKFSIDYQSGSVKGHVYQDGIRIGDISISGLTFPASCGRAHGAAKHNGYIKTI